MTFGGDEKLLGVLVASLEQAKAGGVGANKTHGTWADMTEEAEEKLADLGCSKITHVLEPIF